MVEAIRRLERLKLQATELVKINNRMWAKQNLQSVFDPETGIVTTSFGDLTLSYKVNRADPTVPVRASHLLSEGGYNVAKSPPIDPEEHALRLVLEDKLESYYQSAHRILKLLGTIPSLSSIRSPAVTRVRNNLIEHPPEGAPYSFGFGSSGPRVKPMQKAASKYRDSGLLPNTLEFVNAIVAGCRAGQLQKSDSQSG